MASKYFITTKNKYIKTAMLLNQKKLIEQHYDFLKCKIENGVLVCSGVITSPEYKNLYKVEIRHVYGKEPHARIIEPGDITPSASIHMYSDHSLCLHYPPDMKWNSRTPVFKNTIPWIIEWIVYYELYLVNGGKWEGPESPIHMTESERNISEELDN